MGYGILRAVNVKTGFPGIVPVLGEGFEMRCPHARIMMRHTLKMDAECFSRMLLSIGRTMCG
jgi:hypothetical protein